MIQRLPAMSTVRWALLVVTLLAASTAGTFYGVQLFVLTLAACVLLLVIFLLWSSVQALAGQAELTFEEAFSLGTRSAEEEQKRAVLRALKDLEYERSVGKISEEDFHEYSARYRAEAKRLIQNLNEHLAEQRQQVERELERRLAKAARKAEPVAASGEPDSEAASTPEAAEKPPESAPEAAATMSRECPACQVKNEPDARFCKACGKSLDQAEESAS